MTSTHFPHLPRRHQYAVLALGIVLALVGAILALFVAADPADGAVTVTVVVDIAR